jgi:hypothetical protein
MRFEKENEELLSFWGKIKNCLRLKKKKQENFCILGKNLLTWQKGKMVIFFFSQNVRFFCVLVEK